jgi:hypothetical protein
MGVVGIDWWLVHVAACRQQSGRGQVGDAGRWEDIGLRRNEERGLEMRHWNNWQWWFTFSAVAGLCEGQDEEEVEGVGVVVQIEGGEVDLE